METRDFIETIFGDSEGYLFIGTLSDDGKLNNYKAFQYPTNLNQLMTYVDMRRDVDVYFSPMLYSVPRRNSATVSVTPVVYADTDEFDPAGFLVPPSFNVATSPIKTHSYWVLDSNEHSKEEVSGAARAVALAHASKVNGKQAGVDPSGWDLTQMLRLPGTAQTNPRKKEGYPDEFTVTVLPSSSGMIYPLSEITDAYDPSNLPVQPLAADTELPDDLPAAADVLRKIVVDDKLSDLYSKEPLGDWSDTLYLFCSEMFRKGFTAEEVLIAAWNSQANKYKRDGRPMEHLWRYDVLKAQADPGNRPLSKTEQEAYDSAPPKPKGEGAIAKALEIKLLHDNEHELLTHTFVDKYVNWAASKTDAPAPYHVAGAFTMMSCILGEWGVAYPQFGDLRLGMFFVVMGETTRTRKSTARNLMKKVLRMTQVGDYEYILTSDITPETLLDELSERPHQSSLYDRDEFQALVDDVKHKPYMKNFFETLNEMYDGWARGRSRQNKRTKDTPVNFVQYAMGIRSQIQDNLELSDFVSGYLPRNIFVRGDAPPRVRGENRLRQGNPETKGVDREFMEVVKALTDARNFWSNKVEDRGAPWRVLFEEDAWERWLDFQDDLADYISGHPRADILEPSVERLGLNVLKAAALFTMMDKREKGTMQDVLNAIYFGAQWVEDLIILAEGVSESLYARELEKIEKYIAEKDGLVTYAALLKWSTTQGLRKKDLQEYLEHLKDDGTIDIVEDVKNRKSLRLTYA